MDLEQEYYHNRLDKAKVSIFLLKETLMAMERDGPSHRDEEHKKKKKHKDER